MAVRRSCLLSRQWIVTQVQAAREFNQSTTSLSGTQGANSFLPPSHFPLSSALSNIVNAISQPNLSSLPVLFSGAGIKISIFWVTGVVFLYEHIKSRVAGRSINKIRM